MLFQFTSAGWTYLLLGPDWLADTAAFLCSLAHISALPNTSLSKDVLQLALAPLLSYTIAQRMPAQHFMQLCLAAKQAGLTMPLQQLLSFILVSPSVNLGPQQLSDILWLASMVQQSGSSKLGDSWWEKVAVQLHSIIPLMSSQQLARSSAALAACRRARQLPASFTPIPQPSSTPNTSLSAPPHISVLSSSISCALQSAGWSDAAILVEAAADLGLFALIPSLHTTISTTIKSRADKLKGGGTDQAGCSFAHAAHIESALQRGQQESLLGLTSGVSAGSATGDTAATGAAASKSVPVSPDQQVASELTSFVLVWEGFEPVMGAQEAREQLKGLSSSSSFFSDPLTLLAAVAQHNIPLSQQELERLWAAAAPVLPGQTVDCAVVLMWALSKLQTVWPDGALWLSCKCCFFLLVI